MNAYIHVHNLVGLSYCNVIVVFLLSRQCVCDGLINSELSISVTVDVEEFYFKFKVLLFLYELHMHICLCICSVAMGSYLIFETI
jgi:hypothetical protein